ncbi:hypothetical protein HK102_008999 [Quaeritorhiza haematococci]|nr:hypothetical protein HK102_008999 [Quaeritorhiza haematococci]
MDQRAVDFHSYGMDAWEEVLATIEEIGGLRKGHGEMSGSGVSPSRSRSRSRRRPSAGNVESNIDGKPQEVSGGNHGGKQGIIKEPTRSGSRSRSASRSRRPSQTSSMVDGDLYAEPASMVSEKEDLERKRSRTRMRSRSRRRPSQTDGSEAGSLAASDSPKPSFISNSSRGYSVDSTPAPGSKMIRSQTSPSSSPSSSPSTSPSGTLKRSFTTPPPTTNLSALHEHLEEVLSTSSISRRPRIPTFSIPVAPAPVDASFFGFDEFHSIFISWTLPMSTPLPSGRSLQRACGEFLYTTFVTFVPSFAASASSTPGTTPPPVDEYGMENHTATMFWITDDGLKAVQEMVAKIQAAIVIQRVWKGYNERNRVLRRKMTAVLRMKSSYANMRGGRRFDESEKNKTSEWDDEKQDSGVGLEDVFDQRKAFEDHLQRVSSAYSILLTTKDKDIKKEEFLKILNSEETYRLAKYVFNRNIDQQSPFLNLESELSSEGRTPAKTYEKYRPMVMSWINRVLNRDYPLETDLISVLRSGDVPCDLICALFPRFHCPVKSKGPEYAIHKLVFFLDTCKKIGSSSSSSSKTIGSFLNTIADFAPATFDVADRSPRGKGPLKILRALRILDKVARQCGWDGPALKPVDEQQKHEQQREGNSTTPQDQQLLRTPDTDSNKSYSSGEESGQGGDRSKMPRKPTGKAKAPAKGRVTKVKGDLSTDNKQQPPPSTPPIPAITLSTTSLDKPIPCAFPPPPSYPPPAAPARTYSAPSKPIPSFMHNPHFHSLTRRSKTLHNHHRVSVVMQSTSIRRQSRPIIIAGDGGVRAGALSAKGPLSPLAVSAVEGVKGFKVDGLRKEDADETARKVLEGHVEMRRKLLMKFVESESQYVANLTTVIKHLDHAIKSRKKHLPTPLLIPPVPTSPLPTPPSPTTRRNVKFPSLSRRLTNDRRSALISEQTTSNRRSSWRISNRFNIRVLEQILKTAAAQTQTPTSVPSIDSPIVAASSSSRVAVDPNPNADTTKLEEEIQEMEMLLSVLSDMRKLHSTLLENVSVSLENSRRAAGKSTSNTLMTSINSLKVSETFNAFVDKIQKVYIVYAVVALSSPALASILQSCQSTRGASSGTASVRIPLTRLSTYAKTIKDLSHAFVGVPGTTAVHRGIKTDNVRLAFVAVKVQTIINAIRERFPGMLE